MSETSDCVQKPGLLNFHVDKGGQQMCNLLLQNAYIFVLSLLKNLKRCGIELKHEPSDLRITIILSIIK